MKKHFVLCMFSIIILSVSCKKHLGEKASGIPPAEVPPKSTWIAGLNKEIASVLEEVYRNDSAYQEVNAAIFSNYYVDERVLLEDLLFPEKSELYLSDKFRKYNVGRGIFRRAFFEEVNKGKYPLLKEALEKDTGSVIVGKPNVLADNAALSTAAGSILSGGNSVAIYFPYSENFTTLGPGANANMEFPLPATIVAADRDANSGPGKQPVLCGTSSGAICYKMVTVDDDYAYGRPVHIITTGGKPTGVVSQEPVASKTNRVYLGNARLTKQMDALISFTGNGGGSEIKVARLDGYLKTENQQVTSFSGDLVTIEYSRGDIRKQRWKRVYSIWDSNWAQDNLQQVFAVYEDDTKGTKTFSGSLSTTIGKSSGTRVQGEVAYKIEVATQDDIITQRKLDRASFYRDGMNSQGYGFFPDPNDFLGVNKDWPIYDGGTIWQFTMPWRTY